MGIQSDLNNFSGVNSKNGGCCTILLFFEMQGKHAQLIFKYSLSGINSPEKYVHVDINNENKKFCFKAFALHISDC
jgi:hypothetical protein